MTDPTPLLESSTNTATRALLRTGLGDAPPPEALSRVTAALGLTAGAVAVAAPAAATVNGAAVAAAGSASQASGSSALVLGKWLLAGLAGGAFVSGTASVVERVHSGSAPHAPAAATSIRGNVATRGPGVVVDALPMAPVAEPPAPAVTTAGEAARVGTNTPKVASSRPSSSDTETSRALGVEALRIDAARQALASGDARRALAELDAYQRAKVVGVLDREAALLRIRALVAAGDGARAAQLARDYLDRRPPDAYRAELEAVVATRGVNVPTRAGIDR